MSDTTGSWPIAAALHQFASPANQHAPAEAWLATLREVAGVGFEHIDLTDSWLQIGDLSPARLTQFAEAAAEAQVGVPSLSITRRSVIDPVDGVDNLAYTHRTMDAAATLGTRVLSLGLHRPLTADQKSQLWFWNADSDGDPEDSPETRALAVSRFREIGQHAADLGMLVSLELYEDTYLGTADSAVQLITEIDLPNVGLDPDIGNLVRLHRPIEDWREILAKTLPYTNYWQVKNYFRDEDPITGAVFAAPAPLMLGFINYREAVRDALAIGFRGVICCEHYGGDGLGVSAMNADYLRTLLPASLPPAPVGASAVDAARQGVTA
ncbi:sugar phosphate isomerase/epimerase family protein [Subtercola boreus]|uniref:Xylose isomerase n=1 Tax=Subtercola boreus TaxID=120213 RepID=A0A3E0WB56_9MICO|nr:TIM barrel protein [Subtercola boreus]RFA20087.1 xylose isomerase [Subtercola boreus]RFA20217.1 xylose isomerase [Subtercola boreus]RFA26542.1 xylose isomerase [Subtercola boreus]